ncbi:MAG: 2'-5' RNA ligase family protein [Gemmatimonadota bacterium]
MSTRRQATLFLVPPVDAAIESLRARFNRAQFDLIRAHVTLCREDEVRDWRALEARLRRLSTIEVTLAFERPRRDGHLVYIPVAGPTDSFDALRASLLGDDVAAPRRHLPHITLVHPRNGRCDDVAFAEIVEVSAPFTATFRRVALIEQIDGGPWRTRVDFP